ncbi:MAG TPA: hypothetical protein EYP29_03305, partial [Thermoplasmata archaeon]|nr:hypothetical protein [Thermoplasmata archaeon]
MKFLDKGKKGTGKKRKKGGKKFEEGKEEIEVEVELEEENVVVVEEEEKKEEEVTELDRQKGYLERYRSLDESELTEEYKAYIKDLEKRVKAMEAYAKKRKNGFPLTSTMAKKKERVNQLR